MNTETNTSTTDRVIEQLEATKKEIEQFLKEVNFESSNVEERYQQLRESLKASIGEMEESIKNAKGMSAAVIYLLLPLLSELKKQLENPEQDTAKDIKKLIKGIKTALKELSNALCADSALSETLEKIHGQLQRYRLKFEILKLKITVGTLKVKYASKDMQYQLNLKIQALSKFVRDSKHDAEERWRRFRDGVNKIYSAFSKIHS